MKIGWCETLANAALPREIGCAGMISAECKVEQPEADMRRSLRFPRGHRPAGGAAD
jgi:hypothetical protein